MGKVKLAAHTRNNKEKIRKNKEYEEVGSLVHLKSSKEKEICSNPDDRMRLLKLELESLFNDTKHNKENNKETPTILNAEVEFGEQSKPNVLLPSVLNGMFSSELNNTEKAHEKAVKSKRNKKKFLQTESRFKSTFTSPCDISISTVEELLYKSFYLQVLGINLSTTDDIKSREQRKNPREQNSKCRKWLKKSTEEKLKEKNLEMFYKSSEKGSERRKMKGCGSVDESIEIVEVDQGCSESGNEEGLGLDLSEYDWDEPFERHERAQEQLSDVEILEPCEKSCERQLKLKEAQSLEIKVVEAEGEESDGKRGWECPICFEQSRGQQVVATPCGHIFCKACLEDYYLKFGKCCPTCRTHLINKEPIALYNL